MKRSSASKRGNGSYIKEAAKNVGARWSTNPMVVMATTARTLIDQKRSVALSIRTGVCRVCVHSSLWAKGVWVGELGVTANAHTPVMPALGQ